MASEFPYTGKKGDKNSTNSDKFESSSSNNNNNNNNSNNNNNNNNDNNNNNTNNNNNNYANKVTCAICGTQESQLWLPLSDAKSDIEQPTSSISSQQGICVQCAASHDAVSHNTRQHSARKHKQGSTSSVGGTQREKERNPSTPLAEPPLLKSHSSTTTTTNEADKQPQGRVKRPRKGIPQRSSYVTATVTTSHVIHYKGQRFEVGDVVSVVDSISRGVYFAIIRLLLRDEEATDFAMLTWLLPKKPISSKSTLKPNFTPSSFHMGPQDFYPRPLECLSFECSTPLSASFKYTDVMEPKF